MRTMLFALAVAATIGVFAAASWMRQPEPPVYHPPRRDAPGWRR